MHTIQGTTLHVIDIGIKCDALFMSRSKKFLASRCLQTFFNLNTLANKMFCKISENVLKSSWVGDLPKC